ncbi:MAG: hypothetical protein IJ446_05085 [Oscillospiraceae bacterium]|nr:hypothetical protein [Oscillospiraceae bacterium]
MIKKIIFGAVGIGLAASVIATGTYGLPEEDKDIYNKAAAISAGSDNFGFKDFSIENYPVAFYDGEYDYVVTQENGTENITKRKPVLNSIAATAYPVDEHYEVLTPTLEKMSSVLGVLTASEEYGERDHITTLWHEAFHCWQLTNYYDNIINICGGTDEKLVADKIDTNERAAALFQEQSELLEQAVGASDIDKMREYIVKYNQLEQERNALLSEELTDLENYYEIVEGSACYIEMLVYTMQDPENTERDYISEISGYSDGTGKYYKTGMAQCIILDKLNIEWKDTYDFSRPFIDLINEELDI